MDEKKDLVVFTPEEMKAFNERIDKLVAAKMQVLERDGCLNFELSRRFEEYHANGEFVAEMSDEEKEDYYDELQRYSYALQNASYIQIQALYWLQQACVGTRNLLTLIDFCQNLKLANDGWRDFFLEVKDDKKD